MAKLRTGRTRKQTVHQGRARDAKKSLRGLNDQEKSRIVIENGRKVFEILQSQGWKEIIQPTIDELIESVCGRKVGERWLPGHFIKSRNSEKQTFYIGYATALMEFNNSMLAFVKAADDMEEIKAREASEKKAPLVSPLEQEDW